MLGLMGLLAISFRPLKPVRVKTDVLGKKMWMRWIPRYKFLTGFSESTSREGSRRISKSYPTVDQLVDPKKIIVRHDSSSDSDISMSGSTRSIDTRRSTMYSVSDR